MLAPLSSLLLLLSLSPLLPAPCAAAMPPFPLEAVVDAARTAALTLPPPVPTGVTKRDYLILIAGTVEAFGETGRAGLEDIGTMGGRWRTARYFHGARHRVNDGERRCRVTAPSRQKRCWMRTMPVCDTKPEPA